MLTTQLRQIKSYPTYQLHAYTRSSSSAAEDMFRICILETMKWLRSRLSRFDTLPEQIMLPEPENYDLLSFDMLQSFSLSIGFNISVVFIESRGVWSFELTETDMGENPGTDRERPPVNGRTFRTEISFMLHNDCVEIGIRTICSEPSDTTAPCKVFRPAIVKMLAQNPMIGLRNEYEMNGQPLDITTRSEANRLIDAVQDPKFNIPVVIAAEAPYEAEECHEISAADVKALLSKHMAALKDTVLMISSYRCTVSDPQMNYPLSGWIYLTWALKQSLQTKIIPFRKQSLKCLKSLLFLLPMKKRTGFGHLTVNALHGSRWDMPLYAL